MPDNRNRRLHSIGRMVERVMILDAVLSDRRCWWLSPEADKRTFFDVTQETGLRPEEYPHITFGSGSRKTVRCFPDKLPIGIEKDGHQSVRVPLPGEPANPGGLPPVPDSSPQPLPQPAQMDDASARAAALQEVRGALQSRAPRGALDPAESERQQGSGDVLSRAEGAGRTPRRPDRSLHRKGVPPTGDGEDQALYRAWRRQGDVVLWRSSSTSLRDDRMHGCSACEVQMLNGQYLQLTGTMDREAWAKRGAKRKSRQVGPPLSTASPDIPSPLVAP